MYIFTFSAHVQYRSEIDVLFLWELCIGNPHVTTGAPDALLMLVWMFVAFAECPTPMALTDDRLNPSYYDVGC